ncbi:unnamed protein product [Prorocentrum cordatum]|uniref:Uncharacterized protein n=1 Tax=Prorocentrum cordatum TaxID=2364126 RepID=A0ABN9TPQ2_9DINO|nr:unnamed protein product [Polarella glacialis]
MHSAHIVADIFAPLLARARRFCIDTRRQEFQVRPQASDDDRPRFLCLPLVLFPPQSRGGALCECSDWHRNPDTGRRCSGFHSALTRFKDFQAASPSEGAGLGARRGPRPPHSPSGERARGRSSRRPGAAPARARAVLDPFYSGGPGRGAPRLPPGCPWVCLRFRRCCHGERDAPTPPLGKRPGFNVRRRVSVCGVCNFGHW